MQCLSQGVLSWGCPWALEAEMSSRQVGGHAAGCSGERLSWRQSCGTTQLCIEETVAAMGVIKSLGGLQRERQRD